MDDVVGVSHECDFPNEANTRPRVTKCPVHNAGRASKEIDEWVRRALRENGTIYTIDEPAARTAAGRYPHPKVVRRVCCRLRHGRALGRNFARPAASCYSGAFEPPIFSMTFVGSRERVM